MWGDEQSIYGPKYLLSPFKTFEYAVIGKTYGGSKVGNHIGSIDLAMDYDLGKVKSVFTARTFMTRERWPNWPTSRTDSTASA